MRRLASETSQTDPSSSRLPPHLYFVGSAIFHYLGPSFAVLLFAVVPVDGVAWLRITTAGLVFALWRKPWRSLLAAPSRVKRYVVALGVVFALMNYSFYNAIDRLPLATVAAIEFAGPILLAAAGTRTGRNVASLLLTAAGVYALSDLHFAGDPAALAWAFANAALFTIYIVLAHAVSRVDPTTSPIDRLGAAMLVASVAITPLGVVAALPAFTDPVVLAAGAGVGLSSSVIPYVFDQLAMVRLPRSTYALFVALLPATAVVIGVVVLRQIPLPVELLGVALVIAGVLTHRVPEPSLAR